MNSLFKTIRTELSWTKKSLPTKIRTKHSKIADQLTYAFTIERRKLTVTIQFFWYPAQSSLSCFYEVIHQTNKKAPKIVRHSFMDVLKSEPLPGIDSADQKLLKDAFQFQASANQIQATVPTQTQAKIFTDVITRNFDQLIVYAQSIERGK